MYLPYTVTSGYKHLFISKNNFALEFVYVHYCIQKGWSVGPTVQHKEFYLIFCDNLYGKESEKEWIYVYVLSESLCCAAEINTVNQLYLNKILRLKKQNQEIPWGRGEVPRSSNDETLDPAAPEVSYP